ncbi:glycosyltransferase [Microbacterium amylolyticum]|uniref:UDP-N-acetylglucosamine transferase subunit ALG13 n=1 Tax=Microbacterium amylolyticum TaxID=936337 RepID=A0ABS4ZJ42_9MICO|nr:glycosyltransferase [Microbacterium amylolyticum]MBP2437058.1 UDP-N-acetylglucosamine transferase subunit ALG13 [Microbacterium amylolyticum]
MSDKQLLVGDPRFADVFGTRPKILWVASSGGHVAQAHRIERLLGVNEQSMWITFDVPQTRSLLAGRRVVHVDYVAPRDMRAAVRAAKQIRRTAKAEHFDFVVSTGAAIGFFGLPMVALTGKVPVVYIESLARSQGPSLTGKIMRAAPRIRTYTQYPSWEGGSWSYTGTILDSFDSRAAESKHDVRKIFVTLGTIRPYRFDRLVDAVLKVLEPTDEVTWQLGVTERSDLPGAVHAELPGEEMNRLMAESDVIVTHAGVGSILASLELGKSPIVAVRRGAHSEHVDDHQQFIAEVVAARGLALSLDLDNPSRRTFETAASVVVSSTDATDQEDDRDQ